MSQEIKRVSHVIDYIKRNYARMNPKKFDVVKIGARIYLYGVDAHGNLQRFRIFQGNLPAINELAILKQSFERNIKMKIRSEFQKILNF